MAKIVDCFIIGGGINGTGIALDAAGRGLSVALAEKSDLASATSSYSSKLIHGGLRYLEMYEFRLVRKALKEREILLKKAPHIIQPLAFILPHSKSMRPAWLLRLGLYLYDFLGAKPSQYLSIIFGPHSNDCITKYKGQKIPFSRKINLNAYSSNSQDNESTNTRKHHGNKVNTNGQNINQTSPLKTKFTTGFKYYDCQVDDSRLVVLNAIAAKQLGADILTRTKCIEATRDNNRWHIKLQDQNTQEIIEYKAKALINASGPWVSKTLNDIIYTSENNIPNTDININEVTSNPHVSSNTHTSATTKKLENNQSNKIQETIDNKTICKTNIKHKMQVKNVKGSHIITHKLYDGDHAYILQNPDKRVIFAMPYQGKFTLIGTTDIPYEGDLDNPQISQNEIDYLIESINNYFEKQISSSDIVSHYSGIRPLFDDNSDDPTKVTRDYHFEISDQNGYAPLINIYGGKITTYRILSEMTINNLTPYFAEITKGASTEDHLPGGDIEPQLYLNYLLKNHRDINPQIIKHYVYHYGSRSEVILKNCASDQDLGLHFGSTLYQNEVDYLVKYEWAQTAEDILWRRTKYGLFLNKEQIEQLNLYIIKSLDERKL